ncbi:MAG: deoxynucleoside kinase [Candidatus Aenigmarchaeota archaeon]|nr:deoxynucleoside kinase [Candidatus Aenigmarchaeota archaeon]
MAAKKHFVCVAGNIGSGKTTVANIIESIFNFKKHEEVVEGNPYLPLFYKDMKAWSYKIQRYFLMTRFIAHENISMGSQSCVQDRSIYEDMEIFAPLQIKIGNFTEDQEKRYKTFCKLVYDEIKPPDLLIFLRTSLPVLRQRIAKRGRDYEKNLADPKDTYMEELQKFYDRWISRYNLGPKLVIDTDKLNFVENPEHVKLLINQIKSALMRKEEKLGTFVKK